MSLRPVEVKDVMMSEPAVLETKTRSETSVDLDKPVPLVSCQSCQRLSNGPIDCES